MVGSRVVDEFDEWNYISPIKLAREKKGQVVYKGDFIKSAKENFTLYYQPLIPWVNRLRKAVFSNSGKTRTKDCTIG